MTVGIYDWQASLRKSNKWQARVMAFLIARGHVVDDKTNDMSAQWSGIDFYDNGHSVEFKSCDKIWRTGNVAFELVSNTRTFTAGALLKSKAEWVFYFDTHGLRCHCMQLPKLRTAWETSDRTVWQSYKVTTSDDKGGIAYATVGVLLPLKYIKGVTEYHSFSLPDDMESGA